MYVCMLANDHSLFKYSGRHRGNGSCERGKVGRRKGLETSWYSDDGVSSHTELVIYDVYNQHTCEV